MGYQFKTYLILILCSMVISQCTEDDNDNLTSSEIGFFGELDEIGSGEFGVLSHLGEILELTADQKDQINELLGKHRDNFMRPHFGDGNRENRRTEGKPDHHGHLEMILNEITPILTLEQLKIISKIKDQWNKGLIPSVLIEHRVKKLTDRLNLSIPQQEEIKILFESKGSELIKVHEGEIERFEIHRKTEMIMDETDKELQEILDDDQYETYINLRSKRWQKGKDHFRKFRHKFGNRFGDSAIDKRLKHMTDALDLTEEQQKKIKDILGEAHKSIIDEKDTNNKPFKMGDVFFEHMKNVDKQIRNVLDDKQIEKFDEFRIKRGHRRMRYLHPGHFMHW